ncbi:uncharacterized protein PFL1_00374 [Pseudozyma flocculosa PF-1]|uniref:DUF7330 domain-containing protein n=1 Tax=Pseudozyma flocculosa TaxID=84751 RepID=A0A5C3EUY2_9BASI|nr:uncharacterized protein PFL1_00374 [Pseudozyma flocculosa PF-1]EPQ32177.1 hypothetical protein PFL1_00374 [Pseudozyma flocculosa PF-1]SPO34881.1 uncharacterized protein PSFLO_00352 [Pseudozyma flocculosa]
MSASSSTANLAAPSQQQEQQQRHAHLDASNSTAAGDASTSSPSNLSTREHRRNASALSSASATPAGSRPSSPTFQEIAQKAVISAVKQVDESKLDPHPDSDPDDDDDEHERERRRLAQVWAGAAPTTPYRHLFVSWPHQAIKKTFTIGVSAEDPNPPIFDMPQREVTERSAASCVLVTKHSPINATVHIIKGVRDRGDKNLGKPVTVSAKSVLGNVVLKVPEYHGSRPLHLRAKTTKGDLTVFLPASFAGLLTWKSESGTLKLSQAIQARYKRLDDRAHKHRGTAKIIPSVASGNRGDACELINKSGTITIMEAGEEKKHEGCSVM